MVKNIILTGIPRSGTTLSCRLLNKVQNVLALVEPIDMKGFMACVDENARLEFLSDYFHAIRTAIQNGDPLDVINLDDLSTNTFEENVAGKRNTLIKGRAKQHIQKNLTEDFLLIIKHPNAFTALIHELKKKWDCYAIVRNPMDVINSWISLNHPLSQGHAPMAEFYDAQLSKKLALANTLEERQVLLVNWYFEKYLEKMNPVNIIPYESIVNTKGNSLTTPITGFDLNDLSLVSKNADANRASDKMKIIAETLLKSDGAWRTLYADSEIEKFI